MKERLIRESGVPLIVIYECEWFEKRKEPEIKQILLENNCKVYPTSFTDETLTETEIIECHITNQTSIQLDNIFR